MDSVTREADLGRDVDIWPGGLPGDLDPVRERGGGGLGPAAAAVLRDVLVLGLSEEVPAPHISPEKFCWWRLSQAGSLDELWTRNSLGPGLVSVVRAEALRD